MSGDRPLKVRVAEAVRWAGVHELETVFAPGRQSRKVWVGWPEPDVENSPGREIAEYETDVAETFPLIVKYGISLVDISRDDSTEDLDGRTVSAGRVPMWAACFDVPIQVAPMSPEFDEGVLIIDGYVETYAIDPNPLRAVCLLIVDLAEKGLLPK